MRILFTSTHLTSFIKEDIALLRKHHDVRQYLTIGLKAIFVLPFLILRSDVTYTWFASAYSSLVVLFAKVFGRKSVIAIGGVDVAKYPEIDYGLWLSPWKGKLVKFALRNADKVLAVDPFLKQQASLLAEYDGLNIESIPTGFNPDQWFASGPKEQLILTVAMCDTMKRVRVKGIDKLFLTARKLPNIKFVVAGVIPEILTLIRNEIPPNVEVLPFVERQELLMLYQRAKVYLQPSYVEGLPNSICEAMLCECVPVGSNAGGIPTAIGDAGMLVPYGDVQSISDAVVEALSAPEVAGKKARSRIVEMFPLGKRESSLMRVLNEVMK